MRTIVKSTTTKGNKAKVYSQIVDVEGIYLLTFRTVILCPSKRYIPHPLEKEIRNTENYVVTEVVYAIKVDTFNQIMNNFGKFLNHS